MLLELENDEPMQKTTATMQLCDWFDYIFSSAQLWIVYETSMLHEKLLS